MTLHYEVTGLRGMIDALDEVSDRPSWRTTSKLEAVIAGAFAKTQTNVHIVTGRLKASGRTSTDLRGKVWSGEVRYGGPSGTPAYYGIYELYRHGVKPGHGPHDFFHGLEVLDPAIEDAIDTHFLPLSGGR